MSNDNIPAATLSQRARQRAKRKAKREAAVFQREDMFRMILAGYSYAEAGREHEISAATARRVVQRALDARRSEAPARYVSLQIARLDQAMGHVTQALQDGDLRAVPALVQLLAEYDRYEGLSGLISGGSNASSDVAATSAKLQNLAPKRMKSLASPSKIGAIESEFSPLRSA